jgi:hypothetical protein
MKTFEQFLTDEMNERLKSMYAFNQKVNEILIRLVGKDNIKPNRLNTYAFPPVSGGNMSISTVETIHGKLSISLHGNTSEVYSIFMRFDEPIKAKADPEVTSIGNFNIYSGKWNIHEMEESVALLEFEQRIKLVLPNDNGETTAAPIPLYTISNGPSEL